jgi:BirA family transcriptional regulator, biotin operon repressor / biotin---[acetyl-CoA-carboxylase] ligase
MPQTATVLELLRAQRGAYLSGEDLSSQLAVSRSMVWKHIRQLEGAGYVIEAVPHVGYRLVSVPDRLLPAEILAGLATKRLGRKVICFQETTSTNDRALELAARQEPEGAVVAAEHQTQGRGRRERHWHSQPGQNVLFTVLFRPSWTAEQAPLVTLLMAVAVVEGIHQATGLWARIKWPNDLLIDGAKVAGILTESQAQADRMAFAVCGVGVNVNAAPRQQVRVPATSLADLLGRPQPRVPLLRGILEAADRLYLKALKTGPRPIIESWQQYAVAMGTQVQVDLPDGSQVVGMNMGVDDSGALLVRLENGLNRRLASGEVTHLLQPSQPRRESKETLC